MNTLASSKSEITNINLIMQPDYKHLWYNLSKYNHVDDAHFYAFFEDSLNQFISTNSDNYLTVAGKNAEQLIGNENDNE
jgi:hypothetical protein